jgi:hypothetical protein
VIGTAEGIQVQPHDICLLKKLPHDPQLAFTSAVAK